MQPNRMSRYWALALAGVLLLTVGGAAAQTTTPAAVVRAFVDATNRGDTARLRKLADPAFRHVNDPHNPGPRVETFEEFVQPPLAHVTINHLRQTGPTTVVLNLTLRGSNIPRLPHPFQDTATVTVRNGRVLRIEERIAPQTLQDIMNFGPGSPGPGNLPNTGAADQVGLWSLLALAGICLLGGWRLRQSRA
jgi:hypothetical protein